MGERRRGGSRSKLCWSKIYSFACANPFGDRRRPQVGRLGFSRVVHCNEPDCFEAEIRNYGNNYVRTSKYTIASFLPKTLFEQFRRVANFFFLVVGILAFTPVAPYSASSSIFPLFFVIGTSMVKEGIEDYGRYKQVLNVDM